MSNVRASTLKMEIIKEISWLIRIIINGSEPYAKLLIECNEKLMRKTGEDFSQILIDTHKHLSNMKDSNQWDERGDYLLENLENILNAIKNSTKNPTENAKVQTYLKSLPQKGFIDTHFTIENASKLLNCISASVHLGKMFTEPSFSHAVNIAFYLSQNLIQYERMATLTKTSCMVNLYKIYNAVFSPTPSTFLQSMARALDYGSSTITVAKYYAGANRITLFQDLNKKSQKNPQYAEHLKEVAQFTGPRRAPV